MNASDVQDFEEKRGKRNHISTRSMYHPTNYLGIAAYAIFDASRREI
jgi:hypothetical protein